MQAHKTTKACEAFIKKAGLQQIESLMGSPRFQVIVQMMRELLVSNIQLAEKFASCFLPGLKDGIIRVKKNLTTASAASTLFSLVSCRIDGGLILRCVRIVRACRCCDF